MSSITIHPRPQQPQPATSLLPQLIQTPSGHALLELQGTINFPTATDPSLPSLDNDQPSSPTSDTAPDPTGEFSKNQIGRITFPDYNPDALDPSSTAWMRRVYMYVGEHQRLMGEVKKLPKPVAVVRRRGEGDREYGDEEVEELEVVEVVRYKIVFAQRPEPVTHV